MRSEQRRNERTDNDDNHDNYGDDDSDDEVDDQQGTNIDLGDINSSLTITGNSQSR